MQKSGNPYQGLLGKREKEQLLFACAVPPGLPAAQGYHGPVVVEVASLTEGS